MNETVKLGLVLLIVAAVSGGILAFSNSITEPLIVEQEKAASFNAFATVFTDADDFVPIDEAKLSEIMTKNIYIQEVYEAKQAKETIGYIIKTKSGGYSGDIIVISGFSVDGSILGIRIIQNSETPGLGTRVVDDPSYMLSYEGKSSAEELVLAVSPDAENEVQLLSGATISSKGVLKGVNGAREAYTSFLSN